MTIHDLQESRYATSVGQSTLTSDDLASRLVHDVQWNQKTAAQNEQSRHDESRSTRSCVEETPTRRRRRSQLQLRSGTRRREQLGRRRHSTTRSMTVDDRREGKRRLSPIVWVGGRRNARRSIVSATRLDERDTKKGDRRSRRPWREAFRDAARSDVHRDSSTARFLSVGQSTIIIRCRHDDDDSCA